MAKLTDQEAIKALKKTNIGELIDMVYDYPEDERQEEEWSDWDLIANETGWLLDAFNDSGCIHHEDLEESKHILSITKYGKSIPLRLPSLKPVYDQWDIKAAKDCVNEYNRLARFAKRLYDMGLVLPYYNPPRR